MRTWSLIKDRWMSIIGMFPIQYPWYIYASCFTVAEHVYLVPFLALTVDHDDISVIRCWFLPHRKWIPSRPMQATLVHVQVPIPPKPLQVTLLQGEVPEQCSIEVGTGVSGGKRIMKISSTFLTNCESLVQYFVYTSIEADTNITVAIINLCFF